MKRMTLCLMALSFLFLFTACSKDDGEDGGGGGGSDLIGTWKVVQYLNLEKENGKTVDSIRYGEEKGEIFAINADGTSDFDCVLTESCTWKYEDGELKFYWSYDDGETDDMSYKVVELTSGNFVMEWKGVDKFDGKIVEIYERYELKKVNDLKEPSIENQNFRNSKQLYIMDDNKDHEIGGNNYLFFKSPGFFLGGKGGEGQHMELIDVGVVGWEKLMQMKCPIYNSSWSEELVPCIKGHGYFSIEVFRNGSVLNTTFFYVEDYIKENGNIVGSVIRYKDNN